MTRAEELLRTGLPAPWTYSITEDGRIFFIDEDKRYTTWLHPIWNCPVETGFSPAQNLPPVWETHYAPNGKKYYIDHQNRVTTFEEPIINSDQENRLPNSFAAHEDEEATLGKSKLHRSSTKRKSRRKSTGVPPAAKRDYRAPVEKKGWLLRQEGGLVKAWKKRWCVLSDLCLFCYDGQEELQTVLSIILPGYIIKECDKFDGGSQKFAFKIEHENTKTQYFAALSDTELLNWVDALKLAAVLQIDTNRSPSEARLALRPFDVNSAYPASGSSPDTVRPTYDAADPAYNPQTKTTTTYYPPSSPGRARAQPSDIRYDSQKGPPNQADPVYSSVRRSTPQSPTAYPTREQPGYSVSQRAYPAAPGASFRGGNTTGNTMAASFRGPNTVGDTTQPWNQQSYRNTAVLDQEVASTNSVFLEQPGSSGGNNLPQRGFSTGNTSSGQYKPGVGYSASVRPAIQYQPSPARQQLSSEATDPGTWSKGMHPVLDKSFGSENSNDVAGFEAPQQWKNPGARSPGASQQQSHRQSGRAGENRWGDAVRNGEAPRELSSSDGSMQRKTASLRVKQKSTGTAQGSRLVRRESSRNPREGNVSGSSLVAVYHAPDYNHEAVPVNENDEPRRVDLIGGDLGQVKVSQMNGGARLMENGAFKTGDVIPAMLRSRYIEDLAETRTPHMKQDMLLAKEMSLERAKEPTFFKFPESPPLQQQLAVSERASSYAAPAGGNSVANPTSTNSGHRTAKSAQTNYRYNNGNSDVKRQQQPLQQNQQPQKQQNNLNASFPPPGIARNEPLRRSYDMPIYASVKRNEPLRKSYNNGNPSNNNNLTPRSCDNYSSQHQSLINRDDQNQNNRGSFMEAGPRIVPFENVHRFSLHPFTSVDMKRNSQRDVDSSPATPPLGFEIERSEPMRRSYNAFASAQRNEPLRKSYDEIHHPSSNFTRSIPNLSTHQYVSNSAIIPHCEKRLSSFRDGSPRSAQVSQDYVSPDVAVPQHPQGGSSSRMENSPMIILDSQQYALAGSALPQHVRSASSFREGGPRYLRSSQQYASDRYPQYNRSSGEFQKSPVFTHSERLRNAHDCTMDSSVTDGETSRNKSYVDLSLTHLNKLTKLQQENDVSRSLDKMAAASSRGDVSVGSSELLGETMMKSHAAQRPAYQGQGSQGVRTASPSVVLRRTAAPGQPPVGRDIEVIKEDPNMADEDVLTSRTLQDLQKHLYGHSRLRLSISTNDLVGKSHEELVLLLIQLRRSQTTLEQMRNWARNYLKDRPGGLGHSTTNQPGGTRPGPGQDSAEIRRKADEIDKQIEVTQPLINLLDNMVTMGSLFGGDNALYASQYKQQQLYPDEPVPSTKMLEFSRRNQENRLAVKQEQSLRKLTEEEVDLEEKLQQLYALDSLLQQRSNNVTLLRDDKAMLESAVNKIERQLELERDPVNRQRLEQQRQIIERELSTVRQQLADASKLVEEASTENAKVEQQVIMLRSKVYGMAKSRSTPSLAGGGVGEERAKLEQEVQQIQSLMSGLSTQGGQISQTIDHLKSATSVGGIPTPSLQRQLSKSGNFASYEYQSGGVQYHAAPSSTQQRGSSVREVKKREATRRDDTEHVNDYYSNAGQSIQRSSSMPRVNDSSYPVQLQSVVNPAYEDASLNRRTFTTTEQTAPARQLSAAERLFPSTASSSTNVRDYTTTYGNMGSFSLQQQQQQQLQQQQQYAPVRQQAPPSSSYSYPEQRVNNNNNSYRDPYGVPPEGSKFVSVATVKPAYNDSSPGQRNAPPIVRSFSSRSAVADDRIPESLRSQDFCVIPSSSSGYESSMIDRELLRPPPVDIPERYEADLSDSEDIDFTQVSVEERYRRQDRSDQIKKMLAAQSLQEFRREELTSRDGDIHHRLDDEKRRREEILNIKQQLAEQVKQKTKEASAQRRLTLSNNNIADWQSS